MWSSRAGSGPPLLLLHGVGATHADFTQVRPDLQQSFDVVSVDLPGHGRSPQLARPPTIQALTDSLESHLDDLGIDAVHVLGNSLGGRLALELAARRRAHSVVAIAPFGPAWPFERSAQGAALTGGGLALLALRPLAPTLALHWWGRSALLGGVRVQPWKATPEEAEEFGRTMGSRGYWATLRANVADVPFEASAVRCPVVLAQGTADLISFGQTMRFARLIPGSKFAWLPFAGHAAQGDAPNAVAALVRDTAALASVA
jgi:pimeloyl-ACP methyl ester carboxylesterase